MRFVFFAFFLFFSLRVCAAPVALQSMGEAETIWPGLHYQVVGFKRIPQGRLLVSFLLIASDKAPAGGTFVGVKIPIPADATKEDIANGLYGAGPLSLADSVLIDEKTKQQFSSLEPDPAGQQYRPGEIQGILRPGGFAAATLQFPIPPPPPASEQGSKQTVLLQLTDAKTLIKLTIPAVDLEGTPKAN